MGTPLPAQKRSTRAWQRICLFSLASNAAVLFVMHFGLWLWPEGLPVNSQNIFWLPSGVNLAGLLLLGLRYWPVLLLNAFPVWLLLGQPLPGCLIAAFANSMEALIGAWLISRVGRLDGTFNSLRSIGVLVISSVIAPLMNTFLFPAYLCLTGVYLWSDYARALGNWNLANATAILLTAPLFIGWMRNRQPLVGERRLEAVVAIFSTLALGYLAFSALFAGFGMNLAFLAFPPVLYIAVRFGVRETAYALGVLLLAIYLALATEGRYQPANEMPKVLWFTQAVAWVVAATGLLVAALGAERRRAERLSLEATLAAEQARLAALRYQINPHFLFNALNSIRSTLPLPEKTAREMITSLAGYLRTTLDSADTLLLPLRDELAYIRQYLAIEQHRFGEDLAISYDIAADTEAIAIPSFLIQPLVENAIRHGLEKHPGACSIIISAQCSDGLLHLSVSNTGKWMEPAGRNSTGLRNIRHRLQLLYGEAASLQVVPTEGAVEVRIALPLSH